MTQQAEERVNSPSAVITVSGSATIIISSGSTVVFQSQEEPLHSVDHSSSPPPEYTARSQSTPRASSAETASGTSHHSNQVPQSPSTPLRRTQKKGLSWVTETYLRKIAPLPAEYQPHMSAQSTEHLGSWYVVAVGIRPGIYTDWAEASLMVHEVPFACHEKFRSRTQAVECFNRLMSKGLIRISVPLDT